MRYTLNKLLTIIIVVVLACLMYVTFVGAQDYYPANREWHLWKLQRGTVGNENPYMDSGIFPRKEPTWEWLGEQKYPSSWACARAARPWQRQGNIIACLPRGMSPYDIDL